MRPLIYIAGPYRAPTAWEREQNIHRARSWGALFAKPVIPHANTAHFDGLAPDALFLEGTLELMRRCDGLFVMPDGDLSEGTRAEITEAKRRGLLHMDGSLWTHRSTEACERDVAAFVAYVEAQAAALVRR